MTPEAVQLGKLSAEARSAWAAEAASALASGGLVLLPLETVYALAAGSKFAGVLRDATGQTGPSTWHTADGPAALTALCGGAGVRVEPRHLRLVERLTPGPVRFELELPGPALSGALGAVGLPSDAADRSSGSSCRVAFRVPDHTAALSVLSAASAAGTGPVLASAAAAGLSRTGREIDEVAVSRALASGSLASALDEGPTRLGLPSTTVRLLPGGGFEVTAVGAVPERSVERALPRRVLFVCTGNTCRSPMAEALGRALLAGELAGESASGQSVSIGAGDVPIEVASAGVSAADGQPATGEALDALERLGVSPPRSRSRALTASMLREADAVFTMTAAHAEAARTVDGPSAWKIRPLDAGGDVPDPIGRGQDVYDETAARLRTLVERALLTVAGGGPGGPGSGGEGS